ncbi:MAG TPA: putative Ig domain-containing protein [Patescibacteria group bacterium]|nr:putative Ig domain-containing protein [Patescibacteria group bacterium]
MNRVRSFIACVAVVLALSTISNSNRIEHQYSPAFERALKEAVADLEGLGARRTTAATPASAVRGIEKNTQAPESGQAMQEETIFAYTICPTCWGQSTCDYTSCACQTHQCPTEYYNTCISETCDWETCDQETCDQCGSAPVLEPVGDREVDADSQLVIQLAASDPDGDPVQFYSDAGEILPPSFLLDEYIGLFLWTPSQADAGVYQVTFGVTDGYFSDEETITIIVYYPHGNLPPVLAGIQDIYAYESDTVVVTASATDPDGDPILYSIDDPRFAREDSVFTWITQAGDEGLYPVAVFASDGFLSDAETLLVGVCQQPSSARNHDPLAGNTSEFYLWSENNVSWLEENLGFVSGPTEGDNDWSAAIVSGRAFVPSDSTCMFVRFERNALGNYMFGFTTTEPGTTDFHYSNIDIGVYVHNGGYIRPTWAVNNTGYWNTFLAEGIYDCRISFDPSANRVKFALDEVAGLCDPVSDFASPYWQASEQIGIAESYYIQINTYNPQASVFDVWSTPDSTFVATHLSGYAARVEGARIVITWTLSAVDENIAFDVQRITSGGNESVWLSSDSILRDGKTYICADSSCRPGVGYLYRVFASDGEEQRLLFETGTIHIPDIGLALHQNFPNPFNPSTSIRYSLPRECRVHLGIYDVSGGLIARLVDGHQEPGTHTVEWKGTGMDGSPVASGIYFCRLRAGKEVIIRKMVLMR